MKDLKDVFSQNFGQIQESKTLYSNAIYWSRYFDLFLLFSEDQICKERKYTDITYRRDKDIPYLPDSDIVQTS